MATLYVLQGPDKGYTIQILDDVTILGRHSDQVALSDNTISRHHSRLEHDGDDWQIIDLGSSNGTCVNGERITGPTRLKHGDQIKIGATLLVFGGRIDGSPGQARATRGMVDVAAAGSAIDSSILSAVQSNEDSVIMAAPETADAVRAWHLMYQLAEAIGSISTIHDFLERVTDILVEHLKAERIFVLLRDEATDRMDPIVVRHLAKRRGKREKITTSNTIINHVLQTKSGVLCANAVTDQRFSGGEAGSIQNLALRSVICVPIMARDEVRGIIHLDCMMSRHTYTHSQLQMVTAVGRMCGMASENLRLLQQRMRNERLAAIGETVAYLSHHIRNLLQGLRSGADLVEMGLQNGKQRNIEAGWRIFQNNLDRVHHLTTNMLTFSKDREPRVALTQLNTLIEDVIELARHQADDRRVMLLADLDELPAVPTDADGIHQAVYNLVLNAISACTADSGRVLVKTSYNTDTGTVKITVRDNGGGMTPDQMKHVFQPFHSSKGQGGTGLGLAAAKKIVDELHGELTVKSKPEQGTSFVIVLPAGDGAVTDAEKTHGPPR